MTSDGIDLAAAAETVRQFGHHAGRAWYSGVRVDEELGLLRVYRVDHPAFDSEVQVLLGVDVPISFEDAPHTRDELIVAREHAWAISGDFDIETITIPDDGERVRVFVTGSAWDAQAQLDALVPGLTDVIVSRRTTDAQAEAVPATDRRGQVR